MSTRVTSATKYSTPMNLAPGAICWLFGVNGCASSGDAMAASACASLILWYFAMSRSDSSRRALAVAGSRTGSANSGARIAPARYAASGSVSCCTLLLKYAPAAASMPYAPRPK